MGNWYHGEPAMGFADIREVGTDRLIFVVAAPAAQFGDPEMSDEEKYQNLALAAAAPAMLAALKLAEAEFRACEFDTGGTPSEAHFRKLAVMMLTAIEEAS